MPVVTNTVEVRWFQSGPIPKAVSDWFLKTKIPATPESRADLYLDLAGRGDLGVKVRAGALLELKIRTGVHTELSLTDGLDGRVESWTKWGWALDQAEGGPGTGDPRWMEVSKSRRSRFYSAASDGKAPYAVPPMEQPGESGCAAELVEIQIGAHAAWGIGFEAYGTTSDLRKTLIAGMNAFVEDTPLGNLEFALSNSRSYPAFLALWPPRS